MDLLWPKTRDEWNGAGDAGGEQQKINLYVHVTYVYVKILDMAMVSYKCPLSVSPNLSDMKIKRF